MPFYPYKCSKCGNEEDVYLERNNNRNPVCNACGSDLVRVFGRTQPPVFKGKGFHATDYKETK